MINKEQNTNLQLTIEKNDFRKLLYIVNYLSIEKETTITKSQAISILINRFYEKIKEKTTNQNQEKSVIKKNGEIVQLLTMEQQAKYIKPLRELKKLYTHAEIQKKYNLSKAMINAVISKNKQISKNYELKIIQALNDNKIKF